MVAKQDGVGRDITDLATGGVSAMFATVFTNPIEVVKTRLQLQGELTSRGTHKVFYKNVPHGLFVIARTEGLMALQNGLPAMMGFQFCLNTFRYGKQTSVDIDCMTRVFYKNVPHGLFVIARTEGLMALQNGLPAMMGFQFCLNTFRLGVFRMAERRGLTLDSSGGTSLIKCAAAAGVGGALGSIAGTPFFLVKTRLQSQAAKVIAVGHQHTHAGMLSALGDIYRREGVKGLFRGVWPQIPRGAVGSSSQILSFTFAKERLRERGMFAEHPLALSFAGASLGGLVMTLCLNPFDVVATRLSNQPVDAQNQGKLYSGMIDCFVKMIRSEGLEALYKGVGANYLRLGPHTVLLLVCWDQLKLIEDYLRS